MSQLRNHTARVVIALIALGAATQGPLASADSPSSSWSNERTLTCGDETVQTFLTPAGWATPFHIVGSTDVMIPKRVEVVFEPGGEVVVTLDVPGCNATSDDAVHGAYVDPAGLAVDFLGLRS